MMDPWAGASTSRLFVSESGCSWDQLLLATWSKWDFVQKTAESESLELKTFRKTVDLFSPLC